MVMDVDNNSTKSMDCAVRINGALMNNYQNCLAILIGFVQRVCICLMFIKKNIQRLSFFSHY
mgnify:CR=1 FL=1